VVHRNAAWETNASLHLLRLLVLEGLLNFCFDKRINSLANSVDVSSFHAQTSSLLERLCNTKLKQIAMLNASYIPSVIKDAALNLSRTAGSSTKFFSCFYSSSPWGFSA
jgi:hypothetical protein